MNKVVEIIKNGKKKSVSFTAYRNFFADSGWNIVGEEKSSPVSEKEPEVVEEAIETVETEENEAEDEIPDEEWDEAENEAEVEKPLSEMNRAELIAKAESLGIEPKGNNSQLREAIKAKM